MNRIIALLVAGYLKRKYGVEISDMERFTNGLDQILSSVNVSEAVMDRLLDAIGLGDGR